MILLDTRTPHRWRAPWQASDPAAPVYLIRAGSVIERETIEAELAGEHRAGRVWDFQMREAFETGIDALIGDGAPDEAAQMKALYATRSDVDSTLSAAEAAMLAQAEDVLAEHWPRLGALRAQTARREMLAPVLAFRRFVVGWERLAIGFARGPDGSIRPDVLAQIDPLVLTVAGRVAYGMLYGGGDAGKSDAPLKSGAGPRTSDGARPSKAAGKLRAKNGRAIRSSPARRTSSEP